MTSWFLDNPCEVRTFPICGRDFQTSHHTAKYCSMKCSKEAQRLKSNKSKKFREWQRKNREAYERSLADQASKENRPFVDATETPPVSGVAARRDGRIS